MEKKDQIELGLGIVIILIALTAISLSAVALIRDSNSTGESSGTACGFTSAQVTQLQGFTTQMTFNAQNDLVAKGFTTTNGEFLATDGIITAKSLTCTTLNCTTIDSGTWNGTAIDVAHGGTGLTTLVPNEILCGGTTATGPLQQVASGTLGQFLVSQGPLALPAFADGPNLDSGTFALVLTNVAADWDVSAPQSVGYYTRIGNNYTVYGQILATNTATSATLGGFSVTFEVPGAGVFTGATELRSNSDGVDTTSFALVPTVMFSFPDVTRLIEFRMAPLTINQPTLDPWEFNFISTYRI